MTDHARYAAALLQARHRREALFPPALFDEFAWEILLALYIGRANGAMDEAALFDAVGCMPTVGRRWIAYLVEQQQVLRSGSGVVLHDTVIGPMEEYLGGMIRDAQQAG
ncbi:hypothetical protein NF700_13505 [Sphingomonadaceae bacterium OTU29MARTA1]|uniref:hypothetical protein n=1 Tax=Sphingomonas sp. Leaf37 TaxID=2876552 RepID=UPI001E4725FC|nr:hypothetical protein [Sphingomonas sp. Leaf37]USU04442.1 hypothetical protein NF699_15535 [Sphingomonadaceae bacterium OTU29LAMAA1]USU08086.1 hypothetical protein NF700_13505 [Sphingomonadaceae bacterium OTU29MARTA1]USU11562.1 hypothetical protein NF701_13575 [Sphingomonadaceae bacterium OTU29THOMA1]